VQNKDAELVASACRGDIDSFRQLYERYYSTAVGIARSRVFDQHMAEDAAQEAFAAACRRLHSLRNGERFPMWLATICRRTAVRMARAHRNGVPLEHDPVSPPDDDNGATSVRVNRAMQRLSASGREAIQLHYFSGLSHEEIARTLKISTQAVHGRLQRARRQLASQLSTGDD
jgi:RNA polymerase sigma-70 factor (ECF subfamily)